MSKGLLFLLIVLVVGIAFVTYKLYHGMVNYFDADKLKIVVDEIFEKSEHQEITQRHFIKGLKKYTGVSEKTALALLGKAKKSNLVVVEGDIVKKPN